MGWAAGAGVTTLNTRYRFTLPLQLDDLQQDALRAVPGVSVRRGRLETSSKTSQRVHHVEAPHNAAWVVDQILREGLRVAPVAFAPPMVEPAAVDIETSRQSELCSWLWNTEGEPTTAEPIRFLDFQREVITARLSTGGGHVWAPAGSGKTLVAHAWGLAVAPGAYVVVTKADARETHRRELVRYSDAQPFVWKPKSQVRKRDRWQNVYQYLTEAYCDGFRPIVIVGWDALPNIANAIIANVAPVSIIFDEIHRGKGSKRLKWSVQQDGKLSSADRNTVSSAAFRLASSATYRLGTTATAIRHRPWDLWGQLSLIEPDAWGLTLTRFGKRYCGAKPGEHGGLDMGGLTNEHELMGRLSFSVSRVPHEVLAAQLPPKRRQVVRIAPDQQVKALSRSKEDAAELRKIKALAVKGSGKARHRLNEKRVEDAASRKRRSAVKLAREYSGVVGEPTGKGKTLLITGRRRDCEEIGRLCEKFPIPVWWAHGDDLGMNGAGRLLYDRESTDAGKRRAIQDAYMNHDGACLIVGTIDAWGESLNLQDTDVMLVVQLPYTPGKVDQLEGRGQRLGQTRPLLIVYLIAEDTIDERVAAIMLDKLPAVQRITGGGALDGLDQSLKGLDDREAVLASLAGMFGDFDSQQQQEVSHE